MNLAASSRLKGRESVCGCSVSTMPLSKTRFWCVWPTLQCALTPRERRKLARIGFILDRPLRQLKRPKICRDYCAAVGNIGLGVVRSYMPAYLLKKIPNHRVGYFLCVLSAFSQLHSLG